MYKAILLVIALCCIILLSGHTPTSAAAENKPTIEAADLKLDPCAKFVSAQMASIDPGALHQNVGLVITVTRPMREGEQVEVYDVSITLVTGNPKTTKTVKTKVIEQACPKPE